MDMRRLVYPMPLTIEDRADLFEEWVEANPAALEEMEQAALAIAYSGQRVSAKYLVERQRYEGRAKLHPVPFLDVYGNAHEYGINNSDTPELARFLKAKYPWMDIQLRRRAHE